MPSVAKGDCRDQRVGVSIRAVREGSQGFPRTARLLSADDFTTLFRMRPLKRSDHFVVYARARETAASEPVKAPTKDSTPTAVLPGRLGLVLGRKAAPRAATRNMVRRASRETFRLQREIFSGWDLLIRMHLRFDKQRFSGAASPALKRVCRAEIEALLDEAGRFIARRRESLSAR